MATDKAPRLLLPLLLVGATCTSLLGKDPRPLFDGRTLSGWEGDGEHWRVEDGTLIGEIPAGERLRRNTWLVWKGGEVADFDLRLQVKLSGAPSANSGIQFRCQARDVHHVSGYQADLDQGKTWLGRIYDEHGRGLLVERGTRVRIDPDGERSVQEFSPPSDFEVLFRDDGWNDYRIVGIGSRVAVFVNGTLFSEMIDEQRGERDLKGQLALQLHSGPETRVAFRKLFLERLDPTDDRLGPFPSTDENDPGEDVGSRPTDGKGRSLNLGFERGDLRDWNISGNAFAGQPVDRDGISKRWPGQTSNKRGRFFVGGFEKVRDAGTGTLESVAFRVSHPYASFLLGGGDSPATRVEILKADGADDAGRVLFTAHGNGREQMRRVAVDLRAVRGESIVVRLVDESRGGWGHLNFDDFRFHDQPPRSVDPATTWRSTNNPLLHHLVANPTTEDSGPAQQTLDSMFVPNGFSVDLVAAEPALHQPIAFTFDAKGRLWVVEAHSYPQKREPGQGLDRILIFSDDDGNGSFETRKVFIEGLNLVSGLEVGYGGVWVGAAPELLFIPDRDGDDQPDGAPQVLLDGFGYADTHETLNSFTWGPDGWLYGNQGVFNHSAIGTPGARPEDRVTLSAGVWRYDPREHEFEVFAHGGSNQWGLDFDEFGQLFMTHCRSFWGRGPTTHVVQGGHYWNQVNSGYADFVSARGLSDRPWMSNYLLASARYGHGEGGAGKRGTRKVYGGHAHVGTMIYQGDNWPVEYRNHLFTYNLHGHQINHQENRRLAGGYETVHAGRDLLFCADRQFIGVDLRCGPDGAVYISDWYDPRHCHNPDLEKWDRGNGRLYRMKFDKGYRPAVVDYAASSDEELAAAVLHPNEWHVRAARLVLAERAAERPIDSAAVGRLRQLAFKHPDARRRLRALWSLSATDGFDEAAAAVLLNDPNEYVRAWTLQLLVGAFGAEKLSELTSGFAKSEPSLLVRRYLASAAQRVPDDLAWEWVELLASQSRNSADRELPRLIWYAMAPLMRRDLHRGMALSTTAELQPIRDYIIWYASRLSPDGRERVVEMLATSTGAERDRLLQLLAAGVAGKRDLAEPPTWKHVSAMLYESPDPSIRKMAEAVGAAFQDQQLFQRVRSRLANESATVANRRDAMEILALDDSPENLPYLLAMIDVPSLTTQAIKMVGRYPHDEVGKTLGSRLPDWEGDQAQVAMETLSSRPGWARHLLDAIDAGQVNESRLTAYIARQIANLGDEALLVRLQNRWGKLESSSSERSKAVDDLVKSYRSAPLWAYSRNAGEARFKQLCAACHQPGSADQRLAPRLQGTGSKGIEYVAENLLDPNAVIGKDYLAQLVLTTEGRLITGLVLDESASAVTIQTATSIETLSKDEIEQVRVSEKSFMPEGLLQPLNERERIELLKYVMSL